MAERKEDEFILLVCLGIVRKSFREEVTLQRWLGRRCRQVNLNPL